MRLLIIVFIEMLALAQNISCGSELDKISTALDISDDTFKNSDVSFNSSFISVNYDVTPVFQLRHSIGRSPYLNDNYSYLLAGRYFHYLNEYHHFYIEAGSSLGAQLFYSVGLRNVINKSFNWNIGYRSYLEPAGEKMGDSYGLFFGVEWNVFPTAGDNNYLELADVSMTLSEESVQTKKIHSFSYIVYEVKDGDWLLKICRKFGVSLLDVIESNESLQFDGVDLDLIHSKQKITIPVYN
ncbi:LysM peptidoglycan-binding domain-containing protein [Vibrio cionasavignyae]|uniref:LysM peptidoglycan-binding domain-containing protein n=1 Tax=Vibrio cionasavignyae TaxID=2910252 RepID=UPI003D0BEEB2